MRNVRLLANAARQKLPVAPLSTLIMTKIRFLLNPKTQQIVLIVDMRWTDKPKNESTLSD